MVRWLVHEEDVRLGHPGAGQERRPLPATAERAQRPVAQVLWHIKVVQHDVHAPALAVLLLRGQGLKDSLAQKRVEFDAAANVADGAFAVTTMGGRLVAAGYAGAGGGANQDFAVVRTDSALLFSDGFERGSTGGWDGQ